MLRISINEDTEVAGLWTAEVSRAWLDTAPRLATKKLVLDIRDVTFADAGGTDLLSGMYAKTHARVLADTLWAQSLADQITRSDVRFLAEER
jgi:hypothetical protein